MRDLQGSLSSKPYDAGAHPEFLANFFPKFLAFFGPKSSEVDCAKLSLSFGLKLCTLTDMPLCFVMKEKKLGVNACFWHVWTP